MLFPSRCRNLEQADPTGHWELVIRWSWSLSLVISPAPKTARRVKTVPRHSARGSRGRSRRTARTRRRPVPNVVARRRRNRGPAPASPAASVRRGRVQLHGQAQFAAAPARAGRSQQRQLRPDRPHADFGQVLQDVAICPQEWKKWLPARRMGRRCGHSGSEEPPPDRRRKQQACCVPKSSPKLTIASVHASAQRRKPSICSTSRSASRLISGHPGDLHDHVFERPEGEEFLKMLDQPAR